MNEQKPAEAATAYNRRAAEFRKLNPAYQEALRNANATAAEQLGRWALRTLDAAGFAEYEPGKRAGHNLRAAMRDYDPDLYGVSEPAGLLFGYLDDRDGTDGLDKPLAGLMARAYAQALTARAGHGATAEALDSGVSPAVAVSQACRETEIDCPVCGRNFDAYVAAGALPPNWEGGECPACARALAGLMAVLEDLPACPDPGKVASYAAGLLDQILNAGQALY